MLKPQTLANSQSSIDTEMNINSAPYAVSFSAFSLFETTIT